MNADEHSDSNSQQRTRASFVPNEAWIDAFDAQCTEDMLKKLRRYAQSWARLLGRASDSNDPFYADELVQNAVTDTIAGVVRWDPTAGDLKSYLTDVIRLRARRDRKRTRHYDHVSIEALDPEDTLSLTAPSETLLLLSGENETSTGPDGGTSAMTCTMTRLRALAADDPLVQRFLDETEQDATTRRAIMRIAGLTRTEYHNTRRRLARIVAQLDAGRRAGAKKG
jgi:hypothetical protein